MQLKTGALPPDDGDGLLQAQDCGPRGAGLETSKQQQAKYTNTCTCIYEYNYN